MLSRSRYPLDLGQPSGWWPCRTHRRKRSGIHSVKSSANTRDRVTAPATGVSSIPRDEIRPGALTWPRAAYPVVTKRQDATPLPSF